MKRPSRKSQKRKVAKVTKAAKRAKAVKVRKAAKATKTAKVNRAAKATRAARPARMPRQAARARGAVAQPRRGPLPEGDRQLSDPVEAAQEDARALPEQPLFDRDDAGRDDDLAEMLGEEFVRSVTSGEEQGVELRDAAVPEEEGGPFVETSGAKEFANTADDSEVEPLPTVRAPRTRLLR